jgi:hypothetical protein
MHDNTFSNVRVSEATGWGRLLGPFRRLLHMLLRPIFQRQNEIFEQLQKELDRLTRRQEELDRQAARLSSRS